MGSVSLRALHNLAISAQTSSCNVINIASHATMDDAELKLALRNVIDSDQHGARLGPKALLAALKQDERFFTISIHRVKRCLRLQD